LGNGHLSIGHPCLAIILGACLATLTTACSPAPEEPSKVVVFERVPAENLPTFDDDLDSDSLQKAIQTSLTFFDRAPGNQVFSVDDTQLPVELLKASLLHFLTLLEGHRLSRDAVAQSFDVYRVRSEKNPEQSLVTGYYEPIVEGRLERNDSFSHPLYGLPPDLLTIDLAAFDPRRFPDERLVGRTQGNRVVPYFTRAEIDGGEKLDQYGGQLVWLSDPVDAFFLHVQGSGVVRLPDQSFQRVGYAGANGRPYRSIGKILIERGALSNESMSLQAIRTYLRDHPESRDELLWHNESYVFFRWVKEGPLGSLNLPLTAGRSIATDPRYFPRGALAYLESKKPRLDEAGQVLSWEPLSRWVLNQDTGGAIKGPGRVDLFCGTGDQAEWLAGPMKHSGKLYILVKKGERIH
jgi:membrane-bound lytic murein transglycosylase A